MQVITRYSKSVNNMSLLDRCLGIPLQPPREPGTRPAPRLLRDRLTARDRKAIVEAYVSGDATTRALAAHYDVSDYSIRKVLRQSGVKSKRSVVPEEVRHVIWQRRRDGASVAQIARETGIPATTVHLIVEQA